MRRTVTPQIAGIYHNMEGEGKYKYLMIPRNDPHEYYATDAWHCNRRGDIDPSKNVSPIPHHARDFGDFIKEIPNYDNR
jgi:hypothetical protein